MCDTLSLGFVSYEEISIIHVHTFKRDVNNVLSIIDHLILLNELPYRVNRYTNIDTIDNVYNNM